MADPLATALIAGVFALLVAVCGLIGVLVTTGGNRRTALEARLDKRIEDALAGQAVTIAEQTKTIQSQGEEIKTLKAQMAAVGRVFRVTAEQSSHPNGPDIDPADIALLEDTEVLPPSWVRRTHNAPELTSRKDLP